MGERAGRRRVRERRWCGNIVTWKGRRGIVQVGSPLREAVRDNTRQVTLPEPILRLAQDEYDLQYSGQPYERMQERGGLSIYEVIGLLADALERRGPAASSPSMFSDIEAAESSTVGPVRA